MPDVFRDTDTSTSDDGWSTDIESCPLLEYDYERIGDKYKTPSTRLCTFDFWPLLTFKRNKLKYSGRRLFERLCV